MSDLDLFGNSLPEIRSARSRPGGLHAGAPGTGPKGESCGTCANLARKHLGKTYLKCLLCLPFWTGGGGTDVKARDPACNKWQPRTCQEHPAERPPNAHNAT